MSRMTPRKEVHSAEECNCKLRPSYIRKLNRICEEMDTGKGVVRLKNAAEIKKWFRDMHSK